MVGRMGDDDSVSNLVLVIFVCLLYEPFNCVYITCLTSAISVPPSPRRRKAEQFHSTLLTHIKPAPNTWLPLFLSRHFDRGQVSLGDGVTDPLPYSLKEFSCNSGGRMNVSVLTDTLVGGIPGNAHDTGCYFGHCMIKRDSLNRADNSR